MDAQLESVDLCLEKISGDWYGFYPNDVFLYGVKTQEMHLSSQIIFLIIY